MNKRLWTRLLNLPLLCDQCDCGRVMEPPCASVSLFGKMTLPSPASPNLCNLMLQRTLRNSETGTESQINRSSSAPRGRDWLEGTLAPIRFATFGQGSCGCSALGQAPKPAKGRPSHGPQEDLKPLPTARARSCSQLPSNEVGLENRRPLPSNLATR